MLHKKLFNALLLLLHSKQQPQQQQRRWQRAHPIAFLTVKVAYVTHTHTHIRQQTLTYGMRGRESEREAFTYTGGELKLLTIWQHWLADKAV